MFIHYFRLMMKTKVILVLSLFSVFILAARGNETSSTSCSSADSVNKAPTAGFKHSIVMLTCGGCGSGYNTFTDTSLSVPGNPIVAWNWSFPGGNPATSTLQHPVYINYPVTGDYTVCLTVTALNGCRDSTCDVVNVIITSVSEKKMESSVSIYPNPTSGKANLQVRAFENAQVNIYNILGDCIDQQACTSASEEIDLSSQPKGIYFLKMTTQDGVEVRKIVKSRSYLIIVSNSSSLIIFTPNFSAFFNFSGPMFSPATR
jgi:hypothetical protein